MVKPTHLIGGYAQLSFAFNYLGPTGNQRDEVTVIRRRAARRWSTDVRVMAQLGMVMNLDKCIGCHTCSVTCKQAWTNRAGVEYVWFNNVETRPGQGYPRRYQDQERWKGGWVRNRRGRLAAQGGRPGPQAAARSSPTRCCRTSSDYYEPWTYDYEKLTDAPLGDDFPVAQPKSLLTGEPMADRVERELGRRPRRRRPSTARRTRSWSGSARRPRTRSSFEYEQAFMFYLPRICEHCLNPSCVASCPSGAMYKRAEDGIVLVDQDQCRGWRMCVTGCPYKKVYFNHRTGKAEKCTFCYPRVEVGLPTVCCETCVGRLRYIGPVPLRRRPGHRRGVRRRRARPLRGAAGPAARPARPRGRRRRPARGHRRRLDRRPPAARRSTGWPSSTGSRCRCTRSSARCRWSGTSRRCRRWSTGSPRPGTTARTRATCSAPSTRCASRSSTSPSCSPRATPSRSAAVLQTARRDALLHARRHPRPAPRRVRSPRPSG